MPWMIPWATEKPGTGSGAGSGTRILNRHANGSLQRAGGRAMVADPVREAVKITHSIAGSAFFSSRRWCLAADRP